MAPASVSRAFGENARYLSYPAGVARLWGRLATVELLDECLPLAAIEAGRACPVRKTAQSQPAALTRYVQGCVNSINLFRSTP